MYSLMVSGVSASGMYVGKPGIFLQVDNVTIDLPNSGTLQAASVTISGSRTGVYTFNRTADVNLTFKPNEDVYVTTTNFAANYRAIINYVEGGDQTSYMQTDPSRAAVGSVPKFWRFR